MNKIEKLSINTTNTEVEFTEPSDNNAIKRYNNELPVEYKKVDFLQMPEYWQHRQIESYCDFMQEVISNPVQRITKSNTMIGCALAKIDFPNFSFETQFSPTHFNVTSHRVKIDISFKFDYLEDTAQHTDIEVQESEGEDHSLDAGEKITEIWKHPQGVIELAHQIFHNFPAMAENDKLVMCASLLQNIQSSIDMNSQDSTLESSGFSNDNLDGESELAQKMACAKMKISLFIDSPKHKLKKTLH